MEVERRFDTGDVDINYAEGPVNGPPLLILHGGAGTWQYNLPFIDALTDRWHVFAPDFRGHGRSGHVPGHYTLRDYAADTAFFLRHIVRESASIYGHSLGGQVALIVAAEDADLVRAVINGDVALFTEHHPTEEPSHRAMNALWQRMAGQPLVDIEDALRDMPIVVVGTHVPQRAGDVFGDDSPWFAFQARNLHQLDPDMLTAVLAGPETMLDGYRPDDVYARITCPVLLLQADPAHGGFMRDDHVARAVALLRDATHVRLAGVGHELQGLANNVPRILDAIAPFLDRVRSSLVSTS